MIKIFILVSAVTVFSACGDNKPKAEAPDGFEERRKFAKLKMTREDTLMKQWLLGKEWKAENGAAPMARLIIYSPDSCDYITGKDPWGYKGGQFTFGRNDLVTWPCAKVNDSSFTLYVEPTQKTYIYRFVKNL